MDRQRFPGGNVQAVTPRWQCGVMGVLCVTQAWQHSTPPSVSDQGPQNSWWRGAAASGTVQRPLLSLCSPHGSVTQAFIALSAHGTRVPVQRVLHDVPSSGVAALERALDHNPA